MILFLILAIGISAYNQRIDKPMSDTVTSKELYEKAKKERQ